MKTCVYCHASIPNKAHFCPHCGHQLVRGSWQWTDEPKYLYNGVGCPSQNKGLYCVDIRQCQRTKGLGWEGEYQFSKNLPVGFTGFYAMFDSSENIQVLVENGKISAIFFISGQYTIRVWKGWKEESYRVWKEGWFTSGYKTKYRHVDGIFYQLSKNNIRLSKGEAKAVFKNGLWSYKPFQHLLGSYRKESIDFFGMTLEQLVEGAEYYEN
jgi:hypothetical protein